MKKNILLIIIVSLVALAARFIPHIPNFSPLASVFLFAGVYGKSKQYILLPLIALFISDLFLGFYKLEIVLAVYGSLSLIGVIGFWLKKNKNILNIASSVLASALLFFLLTNFAVWYFGTWYSHDLSGLLLCYNLAIPFFKSTLLSNIIYSTLLFGVYEFVLYTIKEKKLITNE
ncbi:MAG: DUF6580 family putative transport protein [Patescibacteria group bacterium]|jgi:hypothetical protein